MTLMVKGGAKNSPMEVGWGETSAEPVRERVCATKSTWIRTGGEEQDVKKIKKHITSVAWRLFLSHVLYDTIMLLLRLPKDGI